MSSPATPTEITIPDLLSHCNLELHVNPHVEEASLQSKEWLLEYCNVSESRKNIVECMKAGELAAMCYPKADFDSLKGCCDFMNYSFHIDDLADDMNQVDTTGIANEVMNTHYHPHTYQPTTRLGRLTLDHWKRLIATGAPGMQRRYIGALDEWFNGITVEAVDRQNKSVLDLESYVSARRSTSGCKVCWALIEYANNLDFPDEVREHPIIKSLEDAANDFVGLSNDIFSFAREYAKGDSHNMIFVVMNDRGLDLQSAVDFVGDICKKSYDRFKENEEMLPSWGPGVDPQVKIYVNGLADWIVGSMHWSFYSERYFGKMGPEAKVTRKVRLSTV